MKLLQGFTSLLLERRFLSRPGKPQDLWPIQALKAYPDTGVIPGAAPEKPTSIGRLLFMTSSANLRKV
jgi:hypothetical protein